MNIKEWIFLIGSMLASILVIAKITKIIFFSGPKLEIKEVTGEFRSSDRVDDWGNNIATGGLATSIFEIEIDLYNKREPVAIDSIVIVPRRDELDDKELNLRNQNVEYPIELSEHDRRRIEGTISYYDEVIPIDISSIETSVSIITYKELNTSFTVERAESNHDEYQPPSKE